MIPELGQFCLILALLMAALQSYAGWRGLDSVCRRASIMQWVLCLGAFFCLMISFIITDLSVITVVDNSHTLKPTLYKIAGTWGNHEGSMLLWVLVLSFFGFLISLQKKLPATVLFVQGIQGVGFLSFLIFTSNPFARLITPPLDGNDLNPLLQDPALAIHPPMLYLGYVGFSVVFSYAVAYLLRPDTTPAAWAKAVRPWILVAWSSLTAGIALGSWWAYYELGWGGFWFWDPVENASLLPWLLGTGLLHSIIVTQNRGAFARWTILLAILTYSLSLLGTFLVRSGVLTSVHAFAVDPSRGLFILMLLIVYTGGALLLYGLRAPLLKSEAGFNTLSRETGFLLNNLLLGTLAATVFIGTLYPLLLAALNAGQISVGPPYFNATVVPLSIPLFILMGVGPYLTWKRAELGMVLDQLKIAFAITVAVIALTWAIIVQISPGILIGLGLAAWLFTTSLVYFMRRGARYSDLPMTIAHAGMGLAVAGMIGTSLWVEEKSVMMKPGERITVGRYELTLDKVEAGFGPNYSTIQASLTARMTDSNAAPFTLTPERRHYPVAATRTTEAAIRKTWRDDIYVVLGQPADDGKADSWVIRASTHPLVPVLWLGLLLVAVGGTVGAYKNRKGQAA